MRLRLLTGLLVFAALFGAAFLLYGADTSSDAPHRVLTAVEHREGGDTPFSLFGTPDGVVAALGQYAGFVQEEAYAAQIDAELARQEAARQAAAQAASRPAASSYHPGTTVGDCTGFVIPDYIISRESGGNPSAYNPSGAYGCAQTLLSHYSSGSCQGLDPYTIEGQRECVYILSNGGTNLAPWAATR